MHGRFMKHEKEIFVTEDMVKKMSAGSVIVDIAIDQGGCIETVDRVTYHDNPTYTKHDVVHYSVGNMPGAVPRTSTLALTNVTLPYAVKLANMGAKVIYPPTIQPALEKDIPIYIKNTFNCIRSKYSPSF